MSPLLCTLAIFRALMQTLDMLKKFKSKLFTARGAFEGGDDEDMDAPTTSEGEMGVATGSYDHQGDKEDAMKWCTNCR